MIHINVNGLHGVTVGVRKDGSRAVLWDDNLIDWFKPAAFSSLLSSADDVQGA